MSVRRQWWPRIPATARSAQKAIICRRTKPRRIACVTMTRQASCRVSAAPRPQQRWHHFRLPWGAPHKNSAPRGLAVVSTAERSPLAALLRGGPQERDCRRTLQPAAGRHGLAGGQADRQPGQRRRDRSTQHFRRPAASAASANRTAGRREPGREPIQQADHSRLKQGDRRHEAARRGRLPPATSPRAGRDRSTDRTASAARPAARVSAISVATRSAALGAAQAPANSSTGFSRGID